MSHIHIVQAGSPVKVVTNHTDSSVALSVENFGPGTIVVMGIDGDNGSQDLADLGPGAALTVVCTHDHRHVEVKTKTGSPISAVSAKVLAIA